MDTDPATAFFLDPKVFGVLCAFVVLIGLAVILVVAEKAVSIWHKTRRQPPLEDLLREIATKADLRSLEIATKADLRSLKGHFQQEIRDLDKRHSEEIKSSRSYASRTTAEIYELIRQNTAGTNASIDRLKDSLRSEFNSLSKEIGQLQGKVQK